MLVISDRHVRELLTYEICMEAIRESLKAVSSDKAIQPMRQMFRLPNVQGILGWMPGYVDLASNENALGFKLMSVVPATKQRMVHNGVVVLFDELSGHVIALVEAGLLTVIRTPAASAVATDLLARPESRSLAVLGAGHQAQGHLEAISKVRKIQEIKVWSLNPESANAFSAKAIKQYGIKATACMDVQEAVRGADIICTCTAATDPILKYEWISPGTHLNVVGSSIPMTAEIDNDVVSKTSFFVDHKETIKVQGGEYRRALEAGVINENHIQAEIGEILLGKHSGRQSEDDITLYKSVGIVAYDLAAAHAAYQAALQSGLRVDVELVSDAQLP